MADGMSELDPLITKRVASGKADNLDFREYVAREVVERAMPVLTPGPRSPRPRTFVGRPTAS